MVYGLIINNELFHIRKSVHEERFMEIVNYSQLPSDDISVSELYAESIWTRLGKKASQVMGVSEPEFYIGVGTSFVKFVESYGFDKLTGCIARHYRDFVQNLDNVHHYLGDMFVKMKAPSFFVESETANGLTLIYRSKRRGYTHYVIGQMVEISRVFFNQDLRMTVVKQEVQFDTVYVKYQLVFDNGIYEEHMKTNLSRLEASMPFKAYSLFEVFPFSILFDEHLTIRLVGKALRRTIPGVIGKLMTDCFVLVRPLIQFSFEDVMTRTNNVFVFEVLIPAEIKGRLKNYRLFDNEEKDEEATSTSDVPSQNGNEEVIESKLQIKGQLVFIEEWKMMFFLGCPFIHNLKELIENGLFISDMSTHDLSRDMMMIASQRKMELRIAKAFDILARTLIEKITTKTEEVESENDSREKALIPRYLRDKEDGWCKKLERVSLSVIRIHNFFTMCQKSHTLKDVVLLMENIFNIVDHLVKKNQLFLLDTAAGFFMSVGGYSDDPDENTQHEVRTGILALDLVSAAESELRNPSNQRRSVKLKIGLHNGPVIAAFIGDVVQKFCVFGPTLTQVEALCDECPEGKILMSRAFKNYLPSTFRYTNPPNSVTKQQNTADCLILMNMDDHVKVSVGPILKAYTRFKSGKTRYNNLQESSIPNGRPTSQGKKSQINRRNVVEINNESTCGSFQTSQFCLIL